MHSEKLYTAPPIANDIHAETDEDVALDFDINDLGVDPGMDSICISENGHSDVYVYIYTDGGNIFITAVTNPNKGGSVKHSDDGTKLKYKPSSTKCKDIHESSYVEMLEFTITNDHNLSDNGKIIVTVTCKIGGC